ncbi:MAG: flagellar assembly protein T N-terminal domain-containing protein [Burkholderiaceae bacterium]
MLIEGLGKFSFYLSVMLCTVSMPLYAASVEAEGMAVIAENGLAQARRNAIRDAVHQASLQIGVHVSASNQLASNDVLLENSRVRGMAELANVSVIREWEKENILHVVIRAESTQTTDQVMPSLIYKKKVVVVPFHVYQSAQVSDIDDIWNGFPRELLFRLENTNKFLGEFSKFTLPTENKRLVSEQVSTLVKRIASEKNSQFVIAGEVVDAGITASSNNFFGAKKRRFEVQILVYDGFAGILLARHKLSRSSEGSVVVGLDKPFGSADFFSTAFGQSVDSTLDEITKVILNDVEHLPFTAQILRLSNKKIFFNAGATSLVAPGDQLALYSKKVEWAYSGLEEFVTSETPIASVSVIQVHPLFSIGELSVEPGSINLHPGDVVRFVSID